jgi:hypothetical protein
MAHVSVPLFSLLDALAGVLFKTEPKEGGLGASSWFSMREVSSELGGSPQVEKANNDKDCAS